MSEAAAFLRAIHDLPDDDAPRLMYADWLTEHGDAERGEFIHVQCALAFMTYDDPRRPDFEKRQRDLLAEHERAWAGPLLDLTSGWEFRRGFVETVTLRTARFLEVGDRLFATEHPVRGARLTSLSAQAEPLFNGCKSLARLDTLDLRSDALGDNGCVQLAASPHLAGLRRLSVRQNRVGAHGVATLIDATTLPALESLDLAENKTYFVRRGSQFLGSPKLRRIRSLDLGLTGLGDEGLFVLSDCVHLSELRSLAVPHTTLTDRGVRALTSSLYLTELEELDLSGNYLQAGSAELLAEWPAARRLRKLWLHNNAIGDAGVRALARSPHLGGLQFLSVGSSSIGEHGRAALRDRFGERVRHGTTFPEAPHPRAVSK